MEYEFEEKMWMYPADGAWYFISVPKELSAEIKEIFHLQSKGFGSLKVQAAIGEIMWNTSIFPDKKSGSYLLPIKKEVRINNGLQAGDKVRCLIKINMT